MVFPVSRKNKNIVLERAKGDPLVRMQEKYNVYYHSFERQVGSRVWIDGKEMVMLASNDYLGLGAHPKVIEAGKKALDEWGSSTTGARLANGTRSFHLRLEEKLAGFLGVEACHVHSAGYLSCMSAIAGFAQRGDLIVVDKNVHSSLLSGISLSNARVERFLHNNPADLREVLSYEKSKVPKILLIEGVYSMEGHIAPLPEFVKIAQTESCFLIMDDAHGFGVLGDNGRGTANHFGMTEHVDVLCGSFSKALSSTGGFVAGSRDMVQYIRTHSKQTIFSAAISPVQAACAEAALDVMQDEPEHLERLWANTHRYNQMLKDRGLDTWNSETPAIPIVLGTKEKAYYFWKALYDKGVFSVISIAPGVPPGKDLVRTSISALHTKADFLKIEEALDYALKHY